MSVCTLSSESVITSLVEALLPRGSSRPMEARLRGDPSKALYVQVRLNLSVYHDDREEDRATATVHLIFERPSNYTKVWSAVTDEWHIPSPDAFAMRSDHDSCWTTDGLRDMVQTYLKLLGQLRDANPENKRLYPNEHNSIGEIQWLEIQYEQEPGERYKKRITAIQPGERLTNR